MTYGRYLWAALVAVAALIVLAATSGAQVTSRFTDVNVRQINGATPVAAVCDDPSRVTSANISLAAGTGNTQIVALNASDIIYVCGFTLFAGGAGDITWLVGTQTTTACDTSPTTKTTMGYTSSVTAMNTPNTGHVQFKSAAGQALCVNRAASVTLKGHVTYVRQP